MNSMNSLDPLVNHGVMSSHRPTGKFLQFFEPSKYMQIIFIFKYYFNNSTNSTNSLDPLVYHRIMSSPRPTEKKIDQFFEPEKYMQIIFIFKYYFHQLHELPRPLSISWGHVITSTHWKISSVFRTI